MNKPEDARMHPRVDVILKVDYESTEEFLSDFISNASQGGVFIATRQAFKIGESINFKVSFPGLLDSIPCVGEVRWQRTAEQASDEKPVGIGVAFDLSSMKDSSQIDGLLQVLTDTEESDAQIDPGTPFRFVLVENASETRPLYETLKDLHGKKIGKRELFLASADNGAAAIQMLDAEPFDLVILDYYLSDLDGLRFIQEIKESDHLKEIPIILICAHGPDDHPEASHRADFYLGTPAMKFRLLLSLLQLLRMPSE